MRIKQHLFQSSIGRKILMAISGILLVLFLIGHLAGNLQMFAGQDAMNSYAAFLKSKPALVWTARIGLLVLLLLHMKTAGKLKMENKRARPVSYHYNDTVQASLSSRKMLASGLVIFAFIVYHLLHYTFGIVHSEYFHMTDDLGRHDVYGMVIMSFQQPIIAGTYILAMLLLAMHLRHAVASFFQTMGWNKDSFQPLFEGISIGFSILIFLGYSSIPAAILLNAI